MKRIVILGCGGAGKSTLARELGARLGLPVVHLDREFWLPGWVEPDRAEWKTRANRLAAAESWIMDGNYSSAWDQRLAACDMVVLLDFGRWTCLARVARRSLLHFGRTRPDMREGCPERMPDRVFMRYIWTWRELKRPIALAEIDRARARGKSTYVLRGRAEVSQFLAGLPQRREALASP